LIRERAAIEGELASTRRQLDEAHERAAAAERRATELEIEARRQTEREREGRLQEIEGKIGDVVEQAGNVAERARAADIAPLSAPAAAAAEPAAAETEEDDDAIAPPTWVMDVPDEDATGATEASEPEPESNPKRTSKPAAKQPAAEQVPGDVPEGMLSLSAATFDDLRGIGMSVTQAKRVIRHRDEQDGFRTIGELAQIPGFPKAFLAGIKERLVP